MTTLRRKYVQQSQHGEHVRHPLARASLYRRMRGIVCGMEPITTLAAATAFADVVSLLNQFLASRKEGKAQTIDEYLEWLKRQCREHRIDYNLLDTAMDFDRGLMQFLLKRKRLGG